METLNDYKLANKNLEKQMEDEKLSSPAVLGEIRQVGNELPKTRMEENLLKNATEEMNVAAVRGKNVHLKSQDKIPEIVGPEFAEISMKLSRSIGKGVLERYLS